MPSSFQVKSFLYHWLREVDEHSIHSPFFFDFYSKTVVKARSVNPPGLEELRERLLANETVLSIHDFGSGAQYNMNDKRTISEIAHTSVTPTRFALFYLDILHYLQARHVVELGTSLGLTSLYLASKKDVEVYTFEGSHSLCNVAQTNFEWAEKTNIQLIEGNIDSTLPNFLQQPSKIDFVLMDANHRYGPTIRYYHQLTRRISDTGIIVMDDIHRSPDMEKAWNEIKADTVVYGSIDLYRCGILFFDTTLNKQHFVWSLK